jgi:hypothetical protein
MPFSHLRGTPDRTPPTHTIARISGRKSGEILMQNVITSYLFLRDHTESDALASLLAREAPKSQDSVGVKCFSLTDGHAMR